MAKNEKTSMAIAAIAARLMKHPEYATNTEIKKLAASCLTQVADKKKAKKKAKRAKK